MGTPQIGQKTIPLRDWQRFLRVADWWDRTFGHREPGALPTVPGQSVLVKTPEGGIPARSGTTIYSATCLRCVPTESATPGEKTIHETEEELQVYNTAADAVSGDTYVKTVLTPNGTRQAVSSGGGGVQIIRFMVIAAGAYIYGDDTPECDEIHVTGRVLDIQCSGSSCVAVDDEVYIWDPAGCNFNVPWSMLNGATGFAARMRTDSTNYQCVDVAGDGCRWVAQVMCCAEEIYGG